MGSTKRLFKEFGVQLNPSATEHDERFRQGVCGDLSMYVPRTVSRRACLETFITPVEDHFKDVQIPKFTNTRTSVC